MNLYERPRKKISINITSLVDILIVLLLFFMLTTQFIPMQVLSLSLTDSKAPSSNSSISKPEITVTLSAPGRFILEGREFNILQLKEKIKPLLAKEPEAAIMLVSKDKALVQDIVTALDYIKTAGGRNISITKG